MVMPAAIRVGSADRSGAVNWRDGVTAFIRAWPEEVDSEALARTAIRFFEQAFEHTYDPHQAWFGVHKGAASLVVGGIYLAAIHRSLPDRGFWLLVSEDHLAVPVTGLQFTPAKSTIRLERPLFWAHAPSVCLLGHIVDHPEIWIFLAIASEAVLAAPGGDQ